MEKSLICMGRWLKMKQVVGMIQKVTSLVGKMSNIEFCIDGHRSYCNISLKVFDGYAGCDSFKYIIQF
jgi:hypothetical protein